MQVKTRGTTKKNEAGEEVKGRQVQSDFPDGSNLAGFVSLYGENVAFSYIQAKLALSIHAEVRPLIDEGKSDEEIATALKAWKPGTVTPRQKKDPKESFYDLFAKATPEQQAAMVAELRAKQTKK